jgi:DNA-binding transcriptional LysR family regulator
MDYLKTVESFVCVAKTGSFVKAAKTLGISAVMVTRHVISLEDRLQVRLINRTTRKIALTEQGRTFFDFCSKMLVELHVAEEAVRHAQGTVEGTLSILAPRSFGAASFADAVTRFAKTHRRLNVVLTLDDSLTRQVKSASDDFDVTISLSALPDNSTIVVRKLGDLKVILCASPSYLQERGAPCSIEDLARTPCLLHSLLAPDRIWRFGTGPERTTVKVSGPFVSNSYEPLRKAAIAGLGIAQIPTYFIADDLRAGRLQEIAFDHSLEPRPVFALLPSNRHMPKKSSLFLNFLAQWHRRQAWGAAASPLDDRPA